MELTINKSRIVLVQGDITKEDTDAIVNAANEGLRGGGGVDGAIHRAGGPKIMEECRRIGRCPTGTAVITTGGNLKAKHVIHTVGPVYRGGDRGEAELLAGAYRSSLEIASKHNLKSVAFPSISTGVYGYPIKEAARVALDTVVAYLNENTDIEVVKHVLFSPSDYAVYEQTLKELNPS